MVKWPDRLGRQTGRPPTRYPVTRLPVLQFAVDPLTHDLLATTIAGSLPKPAWLAEPNQLWAPWKLEGEALAQGKRDAVRLALFDQEHAGIDIVTDGEQTRRHFVTTFIEGLDGVDFANQQDGAHPQPLRRRRADGGRSGRAPASDLRRRRALPA